MLDKELKFNRYENSFLWLKDAGVVLPIYNTEAPICPLLVNKSSNIFRLFSNDIGLLTSAYPTETKIELINKNGTVNNGAHFENVVAQQLIANGFEPYFCKKKNLGELDFVIEMSGKAVAIEVKSGKDYKKHHIFSYIYELFIKGKGTRKLDCKRGRYRIVMLFYKRKMESIGVLDRKTPVSVNAGSGVF